MIFVDAGTVHALGPGVVMLETQQTSDLTYRMYDYGSSRELHLEKAFAAMQLMTRAGQRAAAHGRWAHRSDRRALLPDREMAGGSWDRDCARRRRGRWCRCCLSCRDAIRISGDGFEPFRWSATSSR